MINKKQIYCRYWSWGILLHARWQICMASRTTFVSIIIFNHLFSTFNHDGARILGLYFPSKKREQQRQQQNTKQSKTLFLSFLFFRDRLTLMIHSQIPTTFPFRECDLWWTEVVILLLGTLLTVSYFFFFFFFFIDFVIFVIFSYLFFFSFHDAVPIWRKGWKKW